MELTGSYFLNFLGVFVESASRIAAGVPVTRPVEKQ
jgi:hypothetical protein